MRADVKFDSRRPSPGAHAIIMRGKLQGCCLHGTRSPLKSLLSTSATGRVFSSLLMLCTVLC